MGKGLANALLLTSKEVFKGATPVEKITVPGYLQYLLDNTKPNIISDGVDDGSGYLRDVKIRYRTRGVPGRTTTADDCSIQSRPAYKTYTVPTTLFRAMGLVFTNEEMQFFERDALALQTIGNGTGKVTQIMKDVYEAIIEQANGLIADIDIDMLALQATNFGKNQVTGSNAAQTINFALNGTNNPLTNGMTKVMADARANEIRMSNMTIVGSGLVDNYMIQQPAKSADQAGLNTSQLAKPKYYLDQYAASAWGANQFALLERDAVQLVNKCRFQGPFAGVLGNSTFLTLNLPIEDSLGQGTLSGFKFDVQLTYRDCPGTLQVGTFVANTNEPIQLGRGWNVIVSASFLPVFIPNDSYETTDRLTGVNGTFRYTATNS